MKEIERSFATGYKTYVRLGNNPQNARLIGFTAEYKVLQTVQILEASVIGNISPVTHDYTEIMCKIFSYGFIPHKDLSIDADKSTLIMAFQKALELGYNGFSNDICSYLDFYDQDNDIIRNEFFDVKIYFDGSFLYGSSTKK
jgi:hypothetical protein